MRREEKVMRITDLLSIDDVVLDLGARSKRALLQTLSAEAASRLGRSEQEILDALQAREHLGSTALGRGVALPHAQLSGDDPPVVLFARLHRPIDFDARDDEPVDLVFLMLWPAASPEGFLPTLSELCRSLRDPEVPRRLRLAKTPGEAVALFQQDGPSTPKTISGER
jgi:PTS system nitrogen regulatory IIA component